MKGKIVSISLYGLKLDKSSSKWINFDKSFKAKDMLSKGFVVELVLNKKGFIVDVLDASNLAVGDKLRDSGDSVGEGSIIPPKVDKPLLPSIIDRNILRGQCLNIVFSKLTWQQISDKDTRALAYEDALVMFKELELKNYYGW